MVNVENEENVVTKIMHIYESGLENFRHYPPPARYLCGKWGKPGYKIYAHFGSASLHYDALATYFCDKVKISATYQVVCCNLPFQIDAHFEENGFANNLFSFLLSCMQQYLWGQEPGVK